MANDIIDIIVTDNSDNVQLNVTPNLVSINVSQTSGNIIGSNYFLASSLGALPVVGDLTTLYITNDTSLMYRWNGSAYIQVNSVTSWGTITGTLSNQTDLQTALNLKAPLASPTFTGTVSGITKSMVGLGNVDNTSDVNKPISSATQTALDGKEPTITAGTSNQYYRGDKTFQSLVTTAVAEGTNLYFTNARSRSSISLTTTGTSGAATYDNITGILNVPAYLGGVTSFNTRTGAITLTSGDVTTALGFTPVTDARTITINGTTYDLTANRSWTIASGVTSFNTRTGAIVPTAGDYTTALVTEDTNLYYTNTRSRNAISLTTTGTSGSATYDNTTGILNIPAYQGGVTSFNTRTGAITLSSSDVTTALGYTPYNATNPNGYTSNVGTVTSVGGTGTVSGLSLSGSVTTSGDLTLGGTLSLTSGNVTSGLGYTPENAANKGVANGYASLDGGGLVPASQLPSYVDDVLEYANLAGFPVTGETGKIYVALDNNKIYRWSGATYIEVSPTVGTIWGGITGTLSNQTDLQNALNAKQANLSGTGFVKSTAGTISYDTATYYPYPTGTTTQYVAGDGSLIAFPVAGQAGTLVRLVRNQTGATLTKGTVVYISGATGNNPIVEKALATGDSTSAQTFGLCQANIANNAEGYVVLTGDLTGLDTSAFTEGQQLYLSPTTAGTYTATKQYAPNHLVYIGVITRSHPTLGQIEVKIQNGYEMDELHNVSAQSPSNNDGLFYNTTTSLWEKKSIATVLGYTPANAARSLTINGTAYDLTADRSWSVGTVTSVAALTLGTTGTDVSSSVATGTTTPVITLNIPTASATNRGALSSTDWTTFNGKQNALSGTGFVKISGTTISYDNSTYYLASNPDGYTTNVGTVTSVALSVPTGLSITGSPITTSGTLALTYAAGYSIPTDAIQTNWTTAYTNRITSLTTTGSSGASTLVSNVLNIPNYTLAGLGGVPTSRSLTINGTAYDLSADRSWTITTDANSRNLQDFTATAGQTTFTVTGGYVVGLLDVYVNGSKLTSSEFTATNGTTFVLTIASTVGDQVQSINYVASVNGISGAGTANYVPKFTATGTIGNSLIFDNGTNAIGIGVVPQTWFSTTKVIQFSTGGALWGIGASNNILSSNEYLNAAGNSTYITTDFATRYSQASGIHSWNTAASGTAGTAIAYTESMRITTTGSVGIGTSSPSTKLHLYEALTNASAYLTIQNNRARNAAVLTQTTNGGFYAGTSIGTDTFNYQIYDAVAGEARLTIASTGAATFSSALNVKNFLTLSGATTLVAPTSGKSLEMVYRLDGANDYAFIQAYDRTNSVMKRLDFNGAVTILGSGNVGIGNTGNASRALEVTQPTGYSAGIRIVAATGPGDAKIQFFGGGSSQMDIGPTAASPNDLIFGAGGSERMRITSGGTSQFSGDVFVNNAKGLYLFTESNGAYWLLRTYNAVSNQLRFNYAGTDLAFIATGTGNYTALSDVNKKKDFEASQIGLNEVLGLKPTLYRMKTEADTEDKHLGFIAQEVKEFIPQAYSETGEGDDKFIGLTEMPIIAALTKAIQELSAKVSLLENK